MHPCLSLTPALEPRHEDVCTMDSSSRRSLRLHLGQNKGNEGRRRVALSSTRPQELPPHHLTSWKTSTVSLSLYLFRPPGSVRKDGERRLLRSVKAPSRRSTHPEGADSTLMTFWPPSSAWRLLPPAARPCTLSSGTSACD